MARARGSYTAKFLAASPSRKSCHRPLQTAMHANLRRGALAVIAQIRHASTIRETWTDKVLQPSSNEVAKALSSTKVWGKKKSSGPAIPGDSSRVNIVSEKLCDDIEQYIGPSLQRHVGCDLLDLFPGAGVWSSKLHDMVRPRSHVLMEPDDALYKPFLAKLLENPATRLVPKSGMIWPDLDQVLASLPQPEAGTSSPTRNDSLLVTANLSTFPRTRTLAQMTGLFMYQLISAIRSGKLFQRYGLVRMLIWARPLDARYSILPSTAQRRTKVGIEAEMACEWVHEVAGVDVFDKSVNAYASRKQGGPRDEWIELLSARRALQQLQVSGIVIPKGRESPMAKKILAHGAAATKNAKAAEAQTRRYMAELQELEAALKAGKFADDSPSFARLEKLRCRAVLDTRTTGRSLDLLDEYNGIVEHRRQGKDTAAEELAWQQKIGALSYSSHSAFGQLRDNLHLFQQEPPVLHWDRRRLEPLMVKPSEFFPAIPCSLIDIQPKVVHPMLRPGQSDDKLFDLMVDVLLRNPSIPIGQQLEELWPDSAEPILPRCPSLRDLDRGGVLDGEVPVRALNEAQLVEILGAWEKWPFRPSLDRLKHQHVGLDDDVDEDGDGIDDAYHLL